MRPVLAIVRREYVYRVLNKWFILVTIGVPIFFSLVFAIPVVIETRESARNRSIALLDETGVLHGVVSNRLSEDFDVGVVLAGPEARARLDDRTRRGEISGYLVLDQETLRRGRTVFRGDHPPSALRSLRMQQAVVRSVLEALGSGLAQEDAAVALVGGGEIVYESVSGEEPDENTRRRVLVSGFGGAFVLYGVILLYGVQVMRSVLEEKTNRIVEVIVSSIEPWQLMLGKILGVGAVGLTQLAIWATLMGLAVSVGIPTLLAARPELGELEDLLQYLPAFGGVLVFLLFFVLGYFLYSSLYVAVAAMCSTDEEAQQTQIPVTMLVVVPVIVLPKVLESPESAFSTWLSLVPFFSPILMFPRFIAGAPLWQVGVSVVLVALTIWAVAWVAGRIYRVGILMQGKRPTLPELVRWVREA